MVGISEERLNPFSFHGNMIPRIVKKKKPDRAAAAGTVITHAAAIL